MNIIYKEGIWIIGKQEQQTWWPRPFNISKSAAQGLCLPRLVQRNPKAHSRNCINREKEIYYGGKAHEKERNTLHANLKVFNHWQFFLSGRCLKPLNVVVDALHQTLHQKAKCPITAQLYFAQIYYFLTYLATY